VDTPARQQLACVAQAIGGRHVDAPDAVTLAGVLNRITQRAFAAVGQPTYASAATAATTYRAGSSRRDNAAASLAPSPMRSFPDG
jgi:hypothetical protein